MQKWHEYKIAKNRAIQWKRLSHLLFALCIIFFEIILHIKILIRWKILRDILVSSFFRMHSVYASENYCFEYDRMLKNDN